MAYSVVKKIKFCVLAQSEQNPTHFFFLSVHLQNPSLIKLLPWVANLLFVPETGLDKDSVHDTVALQKRVQVNKVSDLGIVTEKPHSTGTKTKLGPETFVCVSPCCSGG